MKQKQILITLFSAIIIFSFFSFSGGRKVHIWLIGDSTMAWKKPERAPESGWGEGLKYFVKGNAVIHNHAASGRSTKSFIAQKRWENVLDSIQKGDFVIIQFGHNDEKKDSNLYAEAGTDFKKNIKKFVDETRAKGGNPIICSSIVRRHFDGKGNLLNTHGDYVKAAHDIAAETKTPFADLEASTRKLVGDLGPENSKSLFVFCAPGECPQRKNGVQDSTHLNEEGSRQVAELFVKEVADKKIAIRKFLITK